MVCGTCKYNYVDTHRDCCVTCEVPGWTGCSSEIPIEEWYRETHALHIYIYISHVCSHEQSRA